MITPEKTTLQLLREKIDKSEKELKALEEEYQKKEAEESLKSGSDLFPLPWSFDEEEQFGDFLIIKDADDNVVLEIQRLSEEQSDPVLALKCIIERVNEGLYCKRELEKLRKVHQLEDEHLEPEEGEEEKAE